MDDLNSQLLQKTGGAYTHLLVVEIVCNMLQ